MSIIDKLDSHDVWLSFLETKAASCNCDKRQLEDLSSFIEKREYEPVIRKIADGGSFPPPSRRTISKQHSTKRRTVYIFPREENYVLKLLTYLLIRHYDHIFAKNLYSFRAAHGVKRAIDYLRSDRHLPERYVYKVDIHDYFNSVDVGKLLPMLKEIMADEPETYSFIARLLEDPRATLPDGAVVTGKKGIMAGVPVSSFLANVYLNQLDWHFFNHGNRYARYSDDIIVFARDEAERAETVSFIRPFLGAMSLTVNEDKDATADPHERWEFLGVSYRDGTFDISPVSARKLKRKMWRKSRALLRWKSRKKVENIFAAKAFVKSFNRKLYDNPVTSELTWTRWYFPIINTAGTLADIDHYMQECVRYIVTEKRNSGKFRFTYAMMKELGYRSLVHEYYLVKAKSQLLNPAEKC